MAAQFISGNTLIGNTHLYWILTGPSFAVFILKLIHRLKLASFDLRDSSSDKENFRAVQKKSSFLLLILVGGWFMWTYCWKSVLRGNTVAHLSYIHSNTLTPAFPSPFHQAIIQGHIMLI